MLSIKNAIRIYSIIALTIGFLYWYFYQDINVFVLLFGVGLMVKSIISLKSKDKGEFYLNLGFSFILIFFGIGLLV